MTYEETKARKLKRMPVLRIFNALGMIAWHEDGYGEAYQKLRMVHPFSWVYLIAMLLVAAFGQGVPQTYADTKDIWANETVWF